MTGCGRRERHGADEVPSEVCRPDPHAGCAQAVEVESVAALRGCGRRHVGQVLGDEVDEPWVVEIGPGDGQLHEVILVARRSSTRIHLGGIGEAAK